MTPMMPLTEYSTAPTLLSHVFDTVISSYLPLHSHYHVRRPPVVLLVASTTIQSLSGGVCTWPPTESLQPVGPPHSSVSYTPCWSDSSPYSPWYYRITPNGYPPLPSSSPLTSTRNLIRTEGPPVSLTCRKGPTTCYPPPPITSVCQTCAILHVPCGCFGVLPASYCPCVQASCQDIGTVSPLPPWVCPTRNTD